MGAVSLFVYFWSISIKKTKTKSAKNNIVIYAFHYEFLKNFFIGGEEYEKAFKKDY